MSNLIKKFAELGRNDAPTAGGKGASLGEMTQAGIPVPPGFVVLTDSFERFLEETDLNVEINAALEAVNHEEVHTVEAASEKIQALIHQAKMPADIADLITAEFAELGAEFVAVRSSATAEDGASAAWAGQLDSYLNTTKETLLENVQRCWASLFTPRAIFYRFEKDLHKQKISVAVVVQKMVASEVSGIAFSVHPVTEDYNQLIIEAGFGLGEAIVSGQITPDSYVVEKEPRNVLDINISTQERALYRKAGGGNEWQSIPEPKASSQVLTKEQILELSEIILGIEKHYGFPCDIEWAFEGGKFYIVQSRPITTLNNNSINVVIDERSLIEKARRYEWEHWVDRPYSPFMLTLNMSRADSVFYTQVGLDEPGFGYEVSLYQYPIFYYVKEIEQRNTKALENYLRRRTIFDITNLLSEVHSKNILEVSRILETNTDFKNKLSSVQKILHSYTPFLWLNISLEKYYQNKIDTEVPKYVSGDLKQFISEISISSKKNAYARMLEMMESDEHMEVIHDKFSWLKSRDGFTDFYTLDELREIKNNHKIEKKIKVDIPSQLAGLFSEIQELTFFRTDRTDKMYEILGLVRPIFKDVASAMGITFRELEEYDIESIIGGEEYKKISRPFNCLYIDGRKIIQHEPILSSELNTNEDIKGTIAYSGIVTGVVKIVRHPSEVNKVQQGDVLVSQMTLPSFISAMQKASAFVTDEGGITCHAAIISREMKKPCIIGTKIATRILKDGDMVEVDAEKGVVRKISN